MEKTLVHEDIYLYVDPITEISDVKTAANSFTFINNAISEIADLGTFDIEIVSGSYTKVVINSGNKTATFNVQLTTGNKLTLNFRDFYFAKGTTLVFSDDIPVLADNANSNITITLTGTGSAKVTRKYNKAQTNNNDVWFLDSFSVDTSVERVKKTLLSGKEKNIKGEKKVHSFSINGLWNQVEISKFTNLFRIRLVDENGVKLETLAN